MLRRSSFNNCPLGEVDLTGERLTFEGMGTSLDDRKMLLTEAFEDIVSLIPSGVGRRMARCTV